MRQLLQKDIDAGRIFGPISKSEVESIFPFGFNQCPLSVVPKKDVEFGRITTNPSYGLAENYPNYNVWDILAGKAGFNQSVCLSPLKLPTIFDVVKMAFEGQVLLGADVKSAFRNLRWNPKFWQFFTYHLDSEFFVDMALFYGPSNGPQDFSKVSVELLAASVRNFNQFILKPTDPHPVEATVYIDDVVATSHSAQNLERFRAYIDHMWPEVSNLQFDSRKDQGPSTQLEILGFIINSKNRTVSVPPKK